VPDRSYASTHIEPSGEYLTPPVPAAGPPGSVRIPGGEPGRYRALRFLAKGGLGEVLVAEDVQLGREVALKRIQSPHRLDPDSRRRFLQEAEVTGRLEHPGVVPVYSLTADDAGEPCYAMRLIEGETLHDAIKRHFAGAAAPAEAPPPRPSLSLRQLLSRFVAVCNTVAYAHSRGILHRDIKPQNILLGKYGETLLVDWGLAKPFSRSEEARASGEKTLTPRSPAGEWGTHLGTAVGTPSFMSPEQAIGAWEVVGPVSDVYSLGSTLYCILTGHVPHHRSSLRATLEQARRGEFPTPRHHRTDLHPALEAICLRAMAFDPKDRYRTALELAADVEHWLAGEPVSAYAEPWTERWRRRRVLRSALVALLVALAFGLGAGIEHLRVGRARAVPETPPQERGREFDGHTGSAK
jgi:serine/threonine-protein kinase